MKENKDMYVEFGCRELTNKKGDKGDKLEYFVKDIATNKDMYVNTNKSEYDEYAGKLFNELFGEYFESE